MKQIKHSSFRCQNVNSSLTKLSHSCFPIFLSGISQNGLGIWKAREIWRSHSYVSWLPISTKFKGSMVQIHLRYNKALTEDNNKQTRNALREAERAKARPQFVPWVKPGCPCVSGEVWESQIFGSKESRGTQRKRPHLDCRAFFWIIARRYNVRIYECSTCRGNEFFKANNMVAAKQDPWPCKDTLLADRNRRTS